jgi:hypothetical protein
MGSLAGCMSPFTAANNMGRIDISPQARAWCLSARPSSTIPTTTSGPRPTISSCSSRNRQFRAPTFLHLTRMGAGIGGVTMTELRHQDRPADVCCQSHGRHNSVRPPPVELPPTALINTTSPVGRGRPARPRVPAPTNVRPAPRFLIISITRGSHLRIFARQISLCVRSLRHRELRVVPASQRAAVP